MVRAGDVPEARPQVEMPPAGTYKCLCVAVEKGRSAQKKTPYVRLTFDAMGGETIQDDIYVTPSTVKRLVLVAKRVAGMPDDFDLPDDPPKQAIALAGYIMANALRKPALVTVESKQEDFIGRDGNRRTVERRRVAYAGYDRIEPKKPAGERAEATATAPAAPAAEPGTNDGPDAAGAAPEFEVSDSEIPF